MAGLILLRDRLQFSPPESVVAQFLTLHFPRGKQKSSRWIINWITWSLIMTPSQSLLWVQMKQIFLKKRVKATGRKRRHHGPFLPPTHLMKATKGSRKRTILNQQPIVSLLHLLAITKEWPGQYQHPAGFPNPLLLLALPPVFMCCARQMVSGFYFAVFLNKYRWKRADPYFHMTLQVKTRSRPLLLNLVRDLNLPEGNKSVEYLFFCPLWHFICLGHIISLCRAPVCPPVGSIWLSSPLWPLHPCLYFNVQLVQWHP